MTFITISNDIAITSLKSQPSDNISSDFKQICLIRIQSTYMSFFFINNSQFKKIQYSFYIMIIMMKNMFFKSPDDIDIHALTTQTNFYYKLFMLCVSSYKIYFNVTSKMTPCIHTKRRYIFCNSKYKTISI